MPQQFRLLFWPFMAPPVKWRAWTPKSLRNLLKKSKYNCRSKNIHFLQCHLNRLTEKHVHIIQRLRSKTNMEKEWWTVKNKVPMNYLWVNGRMWGAWPVVRLSSFASSVSLEEKKKTKIKPKLRKMHFSNTATKQDLITSEYNKMLLHMSEIKTTPCAVVLS